MYKSIFLFLFEIWDVSIGNCAAIISSKRNQVSCLRQLTPNSFIFGTDSEELLFYKFGDFGKGENGVSVYYKEEGRFERNYYSTVREIEFEEDLKQVILRTDDGLEFLEIRDRKTVEKKYKRFIKRKKEKNENIEELELPTIEEYLSSVSNWIEELSRKKFKQKLSGIILTTFKAQNSIFCFFSNNSFELLALEESQKSLVSFSGLGHHSVVRAIDIARDDSIVATCSADSVFIWSCQSNFVKIKSFKIKDTLCCKFMPGDRYLLCGSKTGDLSLLDVQIGEITDKVENAHLESIWALDTHPDPQSGVLILSGSSDSNLKFWNLVKENSKVKISLYKEEIQHEAVQWVKFSPNGQFYIAAFLDNSLKVFHLLKLDLLFRLWKIVHNFVRTQNASFKLRCLLR